MSIDPLRGLPAGGHPAYRPDIDGLRAVAILAVLVFHAFPDWLPGGFVGVDIFFVISGFLITGIIAKGLARGDFSFARFYGNRVRRIFPALAIVMAATFAFGWHALLPVELEQLGRHMVAGATFVLNFVLLSESGYFDKAQIKPLLHLWSLAIEEQFYLVYPLLLWTAWRLRVGLLGTVLVLGLASFAMNLVGVHADPARTFFLPHTRFWELLAGAALALLPVSRASLMARSIPAWLAGRAPGPQQVLPSEATLRNAASIVGLALIVAALALAHPGRLFPGWWATLPVGGAFLMLLGGPGAWLNRRVLAHPAMVSIGLISYPLYLWHWPLLAYVQMAEGGETSLALRTGAVALSGLLAWLTYRLVETPIRHGPRVFVRTATVFLLTMVAALPGSRAWNNGGFPARINLAMSDDQLAAERARYWTENLGAPFSADTTNVVVYGDSQANDTFQALRNDPGLGLVLFDVAHHCSGFDRPDLGSEGSAAGCRQSFELMLASEPLARADVLVYAHLWAPGIEQEVAYAIALVEIRRRNPGIRVYFFGRKPLLGKAWVSINTLTKGQRSLLGMNDFLATLQVTDGATAYARDLAARQGVGFVDVEDVFCLGGCVFYEDGKYSYFDQNHWTRAGARRFYDRLSGTWEYRQLRHHDPASRSAGT